MSTKKFYRVVGNQWPGDTGTRGDYHCFPLGTIVIIDGDIEDTRAEGPDGNRQWVYPCHVEPVRQYRVIGNTLAGRVYHRFPIGTLVYGSGDDCSDINGQWQIIFPEHLEEVTDE